LEEKFISRNSVLSCVAATDSSLRPFKLHLIFQEKEKFWWRNIRATGGLFYTRNVRTNSAVIDKTPTHALFIQHYIIEIRKYPTSKTL